MAMLYRIMENMSWYKMNDLCIHLNDNIILSTSGLTGSVEEAMTAYSAFRIDSSVINEKGEPTMKELTLTIEGMMCAHCQKHAADALNALEGVTAEVNLEEKKAYVKADREIADEVFKKAIADAGYEVTEIARA